MRILPEISLGFQIKNQEGGWGEESGVVKSTPIYVF
jgi:hypothetical protein